MPEYTKVITFECEGEEYMAEVYVGKHCSDYDLYQGNKKLMDKPAWLEKAELDPEFNFLFFIDEFPSHDKRRWEVRQIDWYNFYNQKPICDDCNMDMSIERERVRYELDSMGRWW